jgi:hypothetical protein
VPKTTEKTMKQPTVFVHIAPGKTTEHQKKLWRAFWRRLFTEVKAGER